MKKKRIFAGLMALMLCVMALSACGTKTEEAATGNVDVNDSAAVVATVNGVDITLDEFGFFVIQAATIETYRNNSEFGGDFSLVDWEAKTENGKTLKETVVDRAVSEAVNYVLLSLYAEENGMGVTEEDTEQIDSTMEQFVAENSEDMFKKSLAAMGIMTADGYKKMSKLMVGASKFETEFNGDKSKFIEDEKMFQSYADKDHVSVQHILILNDSEKHENPEAVINDVLKRAKDGEDFQALMEEFNEDPGQPPAGYSIGKGEMVPEFENAAFALDYDQISDVVKSDYGYHIIKRVTGLYEFKNFLKEDAEIEKNEAILKELPIADMVTAAYNANMELNSMVGGQANG